MATKACKAGKLLAYGLDQLDRALFRAWLDTGEDGLGRPVSADVMAQAFTADGHGIGPTTLKDHRGRRCCCYRDEVPA